MKSIGAWMVLLAGCAFAFALAAAAPDPHHSLPASKGFITGFQDFTEQGTQPALATDLAESDECVTCHSRNTTEVHYPGNSWRGSMMANATRDPLFWAALDVANRDGEENGAAGIGDFCLRCHTPQGWFGGRVRKLQDVTPVGGQVDDALIVDGTDGCLLQGDYDSPDGFGNDYAGVGCHFCHRQVAESPTSEPAIIGNASAWIDDGDCGGLGEPCRAGPYQYPVALPEGGTYNGPPHAWEYSPFLVSSESCGSCHDVTSPTIDGEPYRTLIIDDGSMAGNDTGIAFPAERTYSEWAASDHQAVVFRDGLEAGGAGIEGVRLARGETCQGCHMPQPDNPTLPEDGYKACFFGPDRTGNLPTHQFAGANTWIPQILEGEFPKLQAATDGMFDNTVMWAQRMLSENSARVETSASLAPGGATLNASVRVTNLAGHKLPTGYAEGRRMWLFVEVLDALDAPVWTNGAWDPATGALSVDAQTRIYEVKQGIWNSSTGECSTTDSMGREKFHFVLNDCIAKDNRIPPLGFRGGQNPEIRPYAATYPETAPGSGRTVNYDIAGYTIPVPPGTAMPLSVRATLRFQISSREYIEFLRNQAVERSFPAENALCAGGPGRPFDVGPQDKSRGQYVYDLWNTSTYGRSPPVNMASDIVSVAAP